jgi:hypothetical protein
VIHVHSPVSPSLPIFRHLRGTKGRFEAIARWFSSSYQLQEAWGTRLWSQPVPNSDFKLQSDTWNPRGMSWYCVHQVASLPMFHSTSQEKILTFYRNATPRELDHEIGFVYISKKYILPVCFQISEDVNEENMAQQIEADNVPNGILLEKNDFNGEHRLKLALNKWLWISSEVSPTFSHILNFFSSVGCANVNESAYLFHPNLGLLGHLEQVKIRLALEGPAFRCPGTCPAPYLC